MIAFVSSYSKSANTMTPECNCDCNCDCDSGDNDPAGSCCDNDHY